MDLRGCLYVLAAAFMWGLIGLISQYIFAEGISPLEAAFWRAGFGWVFFLIHALRNGQARISPVDTLPLLCFGLVCISVFYGSYQMAISKNGVALAAVLLYTAPAWVALLSRAVLGEALTPLKLACVVMTVAGVAAISLGPQLTGGGADLDLEPLGLLIGLIAGFTYALYYIFGKKYLTKYDTPTIFVYAMPVGALSLLPFVEFAHKTPTAWILLLLLAAVTSYGAFSAYYAGLKRLEATRAAVLATFEPVVAAVLAYIFFGERFGLWGYGGSILILAAVFLVVVGGIRRGSSSAPARAMISTKHEERK
ncbi:EamA domain-containing membrane protein RarD [Paucidesulfovibrio gracilis DSM 16080]|uniref:EamA domain-containing membrane protein RarD n=1 Tax=Paucidesulfovibrio gracilis DSM 16080 TaxID=1121449 RepID=A0A1T4XYG2_9BACT|nr:EamA family transporter [Paucidesulfovibrio gracilis]SKA94061.1 EamA domain-containing membrane protein RarD [Paucidesulfovibrio gracilis DSM 16080]